MPDRHAQAARSRRAPGSGVIVEDKGYSVALHYRGAPERERALAELARKVCADYPDEALSILPGKAMVEVKRAHVNKGDGVMRADEASAVSRADAVVHRR